MAEEQEEKAWKSSFSAGGKTYAASLFWQPLLSEDNPLPEIKDAAENILEGADLYVTRKGKSSQFGLAVSAQGFSRGTPSAAVSLVSGLGNVTSFLGVFKVDTGWWYICFRNDVILSDGDTLFANEKDAKDQFISMLAVPDWDMMFAPAEWGIDETNSGDLAPILEKGLVAKLEKISANDEMMLLVIVVAFAIIGWFAYSTLKETFFAPPEVPVIAPVEQVPEQVELPPEPKPWEEMQNPVEVLRGCYEATKKVVEVITPGWKIEGITCNPESGVITSWRRELGRLTWIEQALNVSGVNFSSRVLSDDGNTVMVTLPIAKVSTLNSPPEFSVTDLTNIMNDLNQTLGISLTYGQTTWTSPRGAVYNIMTFSVSSNNDPLIWSEFLMKFSGLSVKEITYDINSSSWSYKGEIYEL